MEHTAGAEDKAEAQSVEVESRKPKSRLTLGIFIKLVTLLTAAIVLTAKHQSCSSYYSSPFYFMVMETALPSYFRFIVDHLVKGLPAGRVLSYLHKLHRRWPDRIQALFKALSRGTKHIAVALHAVEILYTLWAVVYHFQFVTTRLLAVAGVAAPGADSNIFFAHSAIKCGRLIAIFWLVQAWNWVFVYGPPILFMVRGEWHLTASRLRLDNFDRLEARRILLKRTVEERKSGIKELTRDIIDVKPNPTEPQGDNARCMAAMDSMEVKPGDPVLTADAIRAIGEYLQVLEEWEKIDEQCDQLLNDLQGELGKT